MWKIAKQIDFDYGHRVHTQSLNSKYSKNTDCVCRHLHGHRGSIIVYLGSNELNEQGMVTDFKHLNWFKDLVDHEFDHQMILHHSDPLIGESEFLPNVTKENMVIEVIDNKHYYWKVAPWCFAQLEEEGKKNSPIWEFLEGLVFVPFVPTSENLCWWFYNIISYNMEKLNVPVYQVQFYETPKSQSIYG